MSEENLSEENLSEDENSSEDDLPDSPLASFVKAVKTNPSLQEALTAATDAKAVAGIARGAGFVISSFEATLLLKEVQRTPKPWESSASKQGAEFKNTRTDAEEPSFSQAYFTDNTEQRRS